MCMVYMYSYKTACSDGYIEIFIYVPQHQFVGVIITLSLKTTTAITITTTRLNLAGTAQWAKNWLVTFNISKN